MAVYDRLRQPVRRHARADNYEREHPETKWTFVLRPAASPFICFVQTRLSSGGFARAMDAAIAVRNSCLHAH